MTDSWAGYFEPRSVPDPNSGCLLYLGAWTVDGYGKANRARRSIPAHRLSYALAFGPVPDGLFVCHKCDTRCCVNPDHLFIGTPAENSADMTNKGRSTRGEKNGRAKLTAEQVLAIRASSRSHGELSQSYGVSQGMISMIRNNQMWKHV